MKKNKNIFYFTITIALCFSILLAKNVLCVNNKDSINPETLHNNETNINEYFNVINLYDINGNTTYREFFDTKGSLEWLKKMNKDLNSNFEFLELGFQSLEYIGYYNGNLEFSRSSRKNNLANQEVIIDKSKTYVTPLKTVQMGKTIFAEFSNKVNEGETFKEEDFNFNYGKVIPVILGNKYTATYKLNDTFSLEFLQNTLEFKVIGFFEKDTNIAMNQDKSILDNYICMPYFDIEETPDNDKYHLFQQRYYFQKNDGFIKITNLNNNNEMEAFNLYRNKLHEVSKNNNLLYELTDAKIAIEIK